MSAILFPGQGSQYVNMAMDFNESFTSASKTFQEVEEVSKINIRKIISENQLDRLNKTKYTQISIFAASMAIYNTLINEIGSDNINQEFVLGHSLGEYSALVANKSLNLSDASILIKSRAELMNSAIEPNTSGMAALLGKTAESIDDIIKKNNLDLVIANDNSPMQIVVSGLIDKINSSENIFISNGVKKFIKLNVSAAFHSKYMLDAQNKLINELDKITFNVSTTPIISNYDASINDKIDKVVFSLKNQMANKVRWTESIKNLEKTNVNSLIEIGPGKVLSGLVSRISKKFVIKSVDKIKDLEKFK